MQADLTYVNDLDLLVRTARDVGLAKDARPLLWPLLCRVDPTQPSEVRGPKPHLLTDQVEKDVQRSMFLADPEDRPKLRRRLRTVVNSVLDAHSDLSYFQGFHDIASTVLLVCKKPGVATCVVERLALGPLRPMLAPDLSLVTGLLQLLFPIVAAEDAELAAFLHRAAVQPFFALPWVLTWFSHSISSFATVTRLFDLFLATDATMPLFLSAAVVLWCRSHLLRADGPVECEYSAVHSFFSKLFADIPLQLNLEAADPRLQHERLFPRLLDDDLEALISRAIELRRRHARLLHRECARPFVESASVFQWSQLPAVKLDRIPRTHVKSLESLRYRFEGVARKRRGAVARRYALTVCCVFAVAVLARFALKRFYVN
jgi:hypothetical protein